MSKNNYPKTDLAKKLMAEDFEDKLVSKPESEKITAEDKDGGEDGQKNNSEPTSATRGKTETPLNKSRKISAQPIKSTEIPGRRQYVMTYFSDDNYDEFEEIYNKIKRRIRQYNGKRMALTTVAETAIMLALDDYKRDSERFISRFIEKIEEEN